MTKVGHTPSGNEEAMKNPEVNRYNTESFE